MLSKSNIKKLREKLVELLENYNGDEKIKLDLSSKILSELLFTKQTAYYKLFAFDFALMKKLDLTDALFDNVDVFGVNFAGSKGVKINPQTVLGKCMRETILANVEFIGPFHDVDIRRANFTGSKGAKIDPQTVFGKYMYDTILTDTEIIGPFTNVYVIGANFTGSKGAKINPQTVYEKNMHGTILTDASIIGSFNDVDIRFANFTGSKGAEINPQTVYEKNMHGTILTDAKIIGSFKDVEVYDALYNNIALENTSVYYGNQMNYEKVYKIIELGFQKVKR